VYDSRDAVQYGLGKYFSIRSWGSAVSFTLDRGTQFVQVRLDEAMVVTEASLRLCFSGTFCSTCKH